MARGSEAQLQVGENLSYLIQRLKDQRWSGPVMLYCHKTRAVMAGKVMAD